LDEVARHYGTKPMTPRDIAEREGCRVQKVLKWISNGELLADDVSADLSQKPRWKIQPVYYAEFHQRRREARRRQVQGAKPTPRRQPKKKLSLIDPKTGKIRADLQNVGAFCNGGEAGQ